jgi:hypothetical protein
MFFRIARVVGFSIAVAFVSLAQTPGQLSDSVRQQIADILSQKASFTAAQSKMSSDLVFAAKALRNELPPTIAPVVDTSIVEPATGMVQVDVKGAVSPGLLGQIVAVGGQILNQADGAVRADVPVDSLEVLAEHPDVQAIVSAEGATTNVGALTSQGYITHAANPVVNSGINGSGVKVGVLSDSASATRVAALIASGDLPASTLVLPGQDGSPGTDEGTAMMEIIHDLAPGAQLFFATAFTGSAQFAQNIRDLRNVYHCDVIVDDVTYFAEGAFQDGLIAQAVNDVVADGALYFSSAANSGNLTSGTSGTWEGDFLDGGPVSSPILNLGETGDFHNFRTVAAPQNYDVLTAISSVISLKWSDPLGGSSNDYDLFILNSTGTTVKGFSAAAQIGTQDPLEIIGQGANCGTPSALGYCPSAGDRIVVVLYSGQTRALRVDTNRGRLSIATTGSTFGHNAGVSTVSVAATFWNSGRAGTKPFTGFANRIETFSSDGPRKIFFNPDGTSITPGNLLFSTNGGITLQKPDVTAADGVSAKTPGFTPFYGTSAAAPHAAAIAALVKSAKPSLTNAQIYNILTSTALDNMAVGIDRDSGYGIVMALAAVQKALHP